MVSDATGELLMDSWKKGIPIESSLRNADTFAIRNNESKVLESLEVTYLIIFSLKTMGYCPRKDILHFTPVRNKTYVYGYHIPLVTGKGSHPITFGVNGFSGK